MNKIPVFLASDENYAPYCATTILSILDHTKSFVDFYILDGGIEVKTKEIIENLCEKQNNCSIEFIKIDLELFKDFPVTHHFSPDIFSRYLIPRLKINLKKVIYSDVDVIFLGDIEKLYNEDLDKYSVGAVPDFKDLPDHKKIFGIANSHHYFCSGLLLIDCDAWRKENITARLFEKTVEFKDSLIFPDLDVLNIVFENNYKKLDYSYCVMAHVADEMRIFSVQTKRAIENPSIIHYSSGAKPWNNLDVEFFYLFWSYAKKTPLFESLFDKIITKTKSELKVFKEAIDFHRVELYSAKTQLHSAKSELDSIRSELASVKSELRQVYSSREWRVVSILRKLVKIAFPNNSLRRKAIAGIFKLPKKALRWVRKTKRRILPFGDYFDETDGILRSKKIRKINLESKKIAFIGHSYHKKTESSLFFLDYLKQSYDVEIIWDESWKGKPFSDLSFIDESYLGVVFWQTIPSYEILKGLKNDNLVFFPMYDGVPHDWEYWKNYQNLKVVNFSKALHNKLKGWGFESMYIQYFPESSEFIPGKEDEVFFWQRITNININTIKKIFKGEDLKVHIHRAIDPEHKFIQPSEGDEKKFQITYSDWFESRDEMLENIGGLIKQKGIYIAPREREGIGHSFLEAMAMGKAVVAVDNPTMNEYIEHGKTGYLFDLKKIKKIDLSNIEQVQKNAYKFMQKGRKKWENDRHQIIDFFKLGSVDGAKYIEAPLINIITVTYNAKDDLEKTIRSVVSQDYPNINYIIIDGASNDGTKEMIEKYRDKINMYISEKDGGIYEAMNKGILKAKEGYLNFLNAGDEFISNHVVRELFQDIGNAYDIVYGKIIPGKMSAEKLKNPLENMNFTKRNLLRHNSATLCHQAMFIKKEMAPLYDISYKIKGDLDWYFEILERNPQLSYFKSNVVVANYIGGGMSEKRYLLDSFELSRLIIKRFGLLYFIGYKYHSHVLRRIFRENKKRIKKIFS